MASRGEELLISAELAHHRGSALLGELTPSSLQRPGAGVSRAGGGRAFSGPRGWVRPHERVKEMAVDGVSGEVLYPSFAMNLFGLQDAALQGGLLPDLQ